MLEDDNKYSIFTIVNAAIEIWFSFVRFFYPAYKSTNNFTKVFFEYPSIKYLAESSWNSKPSYMEAGNFSKTIIYLLRGENFDGTMPQINLIREALFTTKQFQAASDGARLIDQETLKRLQKLFLDSNNDIDRFKNLLENWFNDTMDRTTGWYKRQNRLMLFLLGLFLAYNFNVDTIAIYNLLAKDKTARTNLVQLAIHSIPKYDSLVKSLKDTSVNSKRDTVRVNDSVIKIIDKVFIALPDSTLLAAQKLVREDIDKASNIAALGWPDKDSCKICDSLKQRLACCCDKDSAAAAKLKTTIKSYDEIYHCSGNPYQNKSNRWIGWLLTAFAISLGAPFWFDLLNKFVALRNTGNKPEVSNSDIQKSSPGSSPINRVG
ncbi:hypothetical protein [Ferruginibacter sp. SUN106]|uniref:hypothetical protein n=1 Tax=Ferruginibacter sp. SUN106 TaxID=2978348 RepID=UPI003D35D0DB